MARFHVPVIVAKNQTADVDPQLKRKLKVYGKETAHTFVDKLFGGQLISTVICETCRHPYQVLEPFMDLSLPVSEEKSPPMSKRRTSVVDSISCLAPPNPEALSKHQQKKLRKTARKGRISAVKPEAVADSQTVDQTVETETTMQSEQNEEGDHMMQCEQNEVTIPATKANQNECENLAMQSEQNEDERSSVKDLGGERINFNEGSESEVEESSSSISTEEEKEGERGDIEDNDDVVELTGKMEDVHVSQDNQDDEDSISQHKVECPPNPALKKMRTEWVARSVCTLAPRYHSSHQECSVQSCLNLFTAPELLTGANKYGCENCTRKRAVAAEAEGAPEGTKTPTVYSAASKQLLIFAPPAILTLHLKRFTQNGFALRKAQKHVEFPLQLDLGPFCSAAAAGVTTVAPNQKEIIYSLYGVIEHSGKLSSGHYTAFVKVRPVDAESVTKFLQRLPMHTDDLARLKDQLSSRLLSDRAAADGAQPPASSEGSWYYCSDAHVMAVTEDKVLRAQAFLLFYERMY